MTLPSIHVMHTLKVCEKEENTLGSYFILAKISKHNKKNPCSHPQLTEILQTENCEGNMLLKQYYTTEFLKRNAF